MRACSHGSASSGEWLANHKGASGSKVEPRREQVGLEERREPKQVCFVRPVQVNKQVSTKQTSFLVWKSAKKVNLLNLEAKTGAPLIYFANQY